GPLRINPAWKAPEPIPGVFPVGAPLDVAPWRFRKEVRLGPGPLHELELDAEVLARADADGDDLRLVRGGTPIPYLKDDPPVLRTLEVPVSEAPSGGPGRRSRWALALPPGRLPVKRISCAVRDPLFRRDVRLVEEVPLEFGVPEPVVLARARWSRVPGQRVERQELELSRVPEGRHLVLEVENGDNPPLGLEAFEALYAAPHLLFKAAPGPGLYLHYGNRAATAPRYDGALLSGLLGPAERSPASLGPEEPRHPSLGGEDAKGGYGGAFLWIVLGLLTVALLFVILRLVPVPGAGEDRS
ncbi:MAG TPA: hypothetical protein VEN81_17625, partial [Planctomycetota bacterium]|nr:hypothetical protein [Planctomycetota bacterium]